MLQHAPDGWHVSVRRPLLNSFLVFLVSLLSPPLPSSPASCFASGVSLLDPIAFVYRIPQHPAIDQSSELSSASSRSNSRTTIPIAFIFVDKLLDGPLWQISQVVTRLTPAAIITSSASLSNLLSAPAALLTQSPKRRYSDTSEGSDGYYDRSRKSPRPNPHEATPIRPPPVLQCSPIAAPGSDQTQQQQQPAAQPGRHAQARMRSSIACVRCRRSKVKCVNSGVGTPCRSCEASGRECTYPVPVSGGRRREGSLSGPAQRPDGLGDIEVGHNERIPGECSTN